MPLVIPPDHLQVAIYLRYQDSPRLAAITFGVRELDPTRTPAETLSVATALWLAAFEGELHNDVTAINSIGTLEDGGNYFTVSEPLNNPGTGGDFAAPPPNVAALLRKRTDRPGRGGRGRMYLPWCFDESAVNALGRLDGAVIAALDDAGETWLASGAAGLQEVVLLHNIGTPGGTTPTVINAIVPDTQIATQRRRNRA